MSEAEQASTQDEGAEDVIEFDGEFDPERAARTIARQRAEEARLKEKVAEMAADLEKFKAAEAAKIEQEKSLEERLIEARREAEEARTQLQETRVESDFKTKAADLGLDPELAYLAAKKDGLVGQFDPDTGSVGNHDLDSLIDKYPNLVKDRSSGQRAPKPGGDAGVRSPGRPKTAKDQFNEAVRGALGK